MNFASSFESGSNSQRDGAPLRDGAPFFSSDSGKISAPLILASASPRRAQLLEIIGVPFEVAPSNIDEAAPDAADCAQPQLYVERLARLKAQACQPDTKYFVSHNRDASLLILAADTIVWHDGAILNKPRDTDEARQMLQTLRGREHRVLTGVCLRVEAGGAPECETKYFVSHETTRVWFRHVGDDWIARYVATSEPMDKAGAYAAQRLGAILIEKIEGDFWNVVGLPLARLAQMLEAADRPVENWWKDKSKV